MGIIDEYFGGYDNLAMYSNSDGDVDFDDAYGTSWDFSCNRNRRSRSSSESDSGSDRDSRSCENDHAAHCLACGGAGPDTHTDSSIHISKKQKTSDQLAKTRRSLAVEIKVPNDTCEAACDRFSISRCVGPSE